MELAKTKVQFYEELEDPLGGSFIRANSVQDLPVRNGKKILNQNAFLRNQWKETES